MKQYLYIFVLALLLQNAYADTGYASFQPQTTQTLYASCSENGVLQATNANITVLYPDASLHVVLNASAIPGRTGVFNASYTTTSTEGVYGAIVNCSNGANAAGSFQVKNDVMGDDMTTIAMMLGVIALGVALLYFSNKEGEKVKTGSSHTVIILRVIYAKLLYIASFWLIPVFCMLLVYFTQNTALKNFFDNVMVVALIGASVVTLCMFVIILFEIYGLGINAMDLHKQRKQERKGIQ